MSLLSAWSISLDSTFKSSLVILLPFGNHKLRSDLVSWVFSGWFWVDVYKGVCVVYYIICEYQIFQSLKKSIKPLLHGNMV